MNPYFAIAARAARKIKKSRERKQLDLREASSKSTDDFFRELSSATSSVKKEEAR
jgi:hypothetical protein